MTKNVWSYLLLIRSPVTFIPGNPYWDRSPVLGANYLEFDWIVPKTGLQP